ncbi:hypothetical protein D3C76_1255500 [compost metagenome]
MWIYLRLQCSKLIGFVRQLKLIFLQDQIVDGVHHAAKSNHNRTNLVVAGRFNIDIQVTDLDFIHIFAQLFDR